MPLCTLACLLEASQAEVWQALTANAHPEAPRSAGAGDWPHGWQFHAARALHNHFRERVQLPSPRPDCGLTAIPRMLIALRLRLMRAKPVERAEAVGCAAVAGTPVPRELMPPISGGWTSSSTGHGFRREPPIATAQRCVQQSNASSLSSRSYRAWGRTAFACEVVRAAVPARVDRTNW